MTRKQALEQAIELCKENNKTEVSEVLMSLCNELPLVRWTQESIVDAVKQFHIDYHRPPRAKEFDNNPKLPCHAMVRLRFGTGTHALVTKCFPPKCCSERYGHKTPEEWRELLTAQLKQFDQPHATIYNKLKTDDMPTSFVIKRILGVDKWADVLQLCGLEIAEHSPELTVSATYKYDANSHDDILEHLNSVVDRESDIVV